MKRIAIRKATARRIAGAILLLMGAVLNAPALEAGAPTPTQFTYQGLLENGGSPANGNFDFEFTLWNAEVSGTQLGSAILLQDVPVEDGVFQVELDFGGSAFNGELRWLRIRVALANGGLTTLSPRQQVAAAPYAVFAHSGNEGPQGPPGDDALWEDNGSDRMWFLGDHVSIGTDSPDGAFHVQTSGVSDAIIATTSASGGTGVKAYGPSVGVYGEALLGLDGIGVYGLGRFAGVVGITGSDSSGPGLFGQTSGPVAWGIEGAGVTQGISGYASASSGVTTGVSGHVSSSSGTGVRGTGPTRGVEGSASSISGVTYGVIGTTPSSLGRGVFGHATATSGVPIGVYAKADTNTGYDFYADGAGLDYGGTSSRRWKSSVVPIGQPLEKLSRLRGVYFDWDLWHGGHHDVGMIAEEVGKVLPEIVQYEENGIDATGMDYSRLTPLLVEATNALRAQTESRLGVLERENAALRARIGSLEMQLQRIPRAGEAVEP